MNARTTTIIADTNRMDAGIADVRDNVLPAVSDMDGCIGLSMLCDRDSGRCIVTTAWESEEAMAGTRDRVMQMRARATEQFGASDSQVQEWEIAVMHRLHGAGDDSCARVTWSRIDPGQMDRMIDTFRTGFLPRLDEVPGFCSLSMLVDRDNGRAVGTAVFESRAALEQSREQARMLREQSVNAMGVDILDVAEMDLVVAHLRVPETV
jgi:heme-degrading monooxygenase HmoA